MLFLWFLVCSFIFAIAGYNFALFVCSCYWCLLITNLSHTSDSCIDGFALDRSIIFPLKRLLKRIIVQRIRESCMSPLASAFFIGYLFFINIFSTCFLSTFLSRRPCHDVQPTFCVLLYILPFLVDAACQPPKLGRLFCVIIIVYAFVNLYNTPGGGRI